MINKGEDILSNTDLISANGSVLYAIWTFHDRYNAEALTSSTQQQEKIYII